MLVGYAVCFRQNLAPTVFAGCLFAEKRQQFCRYAFLTVFVDARQQEVRSFVVLGWLPMGEVDIAGLEDSPHMVFQGMACPGFSSILD